MVTFSNSTASRALQDLIHQLSAYRRPTRHQGRTTHALALKLASSRSPHVTHPAQHLSRPYKVPSTSNSPCRITRQHPLTFLSRADSLLCPPFPHHAVPVCWVSRRGLSPASPSASGQHRTMSIWRDVLIFRFLCLPQRP